MVLSGGGGGQLKSGPLRIVKGSGWAVKCPHCEHDLDGVNADLLMASGSGVLAFGKRYIYSCPSCNKVLGVSHRKGFWMG
jgi:hypothetical protein